MNLRLKLLADYYLGGTAHVLLKPFVMLLGRILRRDHSLEKIDELIVIKMLGGGSLVIAYPSLLALRRHRPQLRLKLVTTPPIVPFARTLQIFDEIIVIRDHQFLLLTFDCLSVVIRLWRVPAILDLEIHSRFSAILTLLTCAINRIGIYTDLSFWRKSLYTHLLFYNKYAPIHNLYDQVVALLGVNEVDFSSAQDQFTQFVSKDAEALTGHSQDLIAIAPACSEYGRERMLSVEAWVQILKREIPLLKNSAIHVIGGRADFDYAEKILTSLRDFFPQVTMVNQCGRISLAESISLISQLRFLYCIDSSLIHFARLLRVKTISYWGPTDPYSRLRPYPGCQDETHYARLSCSPCIHIALQAPCYGNNLCMQACLGGATDVPSNPIWLAKS